MSEQAEPHLFPKSSSHDGKKPFTETEAAEICSKKPWYRYYQCQHCSNYHLTKTMNPRMWHKRHQTDLIRQSNVAVLERLLDALPEKKTGSSVRRVIS